MTPLRCALAFFCVACAEPLNILPDLDGSWLVELQVGSEEVRQGGADFGWDADREELDGSIEVVEAEAERTFELLDAVDVQQLGIAMAWIERGGVRQLFMEITPPAGGSASGAWRTQWGCAEAVGSLCGEQGAVDFERP